LFLWPSWPVHQLVHPHCPEVIIFSWGNGNFDNQLFILQQDIIKSVRLLVWWQLKQLHDLSHIHYICHFHSLKLTVVKLSLCTVKFCNYLRIKLNWIELFQICLSYHETAFRSDLHDLFICIVDNSSDSIESDKERDCDFWSEMLQNLPQTNNTTIWNPMKLESILLLTVTDLLEFFISWVRCLIIRHSRKNQWD
jgi:hypothetical protein